MSKEHYSGYEDEIREYRLSFNRAFAYTAIVLILLGMGLDYGLYPHLQYLFGAARIVVSLLIYCIIIILRTKWGQDRAEMLAFVWLLLPQIMITWMIAATEGATSMYSIGLYLAIFGASLGLPTTFRFNLVLGFVTFLLYLAACSIHPESFMLHGAFVVNSLILLFVIVISAVSCFFNERARFILFRLKTEVAEKNRQLEETNKNLADIKGQMLQQEKMAAIGTLAAGMLHEVNNPVNYCLMAMDIALEDPVAKSSAALNECLVDAKQGMQRVQHIVSDLKTFAYRSSETSSDGTVFLLEKVVDSAIRLVGHEIKGITITRDMPADTLVRGDEAAIIGVLVNLFGNAALAMRAANRSEPAIHLSAAWESNRLRVTVQDNGPGIAPENIARVFEPFFTTREIGQGLGLGLSISYRVIEQHGGTLVAESVVGEWTKMIFDLPRAT
ncbi:MAG: two-component sensor histidine kinase [Nitrosomonadales bacterium]|nr:two-component sensor histidine kinase [Nitrosomonadales bacterium]